MHFQISPEVKFELKPFDAYHLQTPSTETKNGTENLRVINLIKPVTAMDWSPTNYDRKSSLEPVQFLAVATEPILELTGTFASPNVITGDSDCMLKIYQTPNLVHFFRTSQPDLTSSWSHFALVNRHVGMINVIKWRPDFGASRSRLGSQDFIGYLLIAGSDGNGYVYLIEDFTRHPEFKIDSKNGLLLL